MTVNRYCSSSLQTVRMAAHAIRAGEGDVLSEPAWIGSRQTPRSARTPTS